MLPNTGVFVCYRFTVLSGIAGRKNPQPSPLLPPCWGRRKKKRGRDSFSRRSVPFGSSSWTETIVRKGAERKGVQIWLLPPCVHTSSPIVFSSQWPALATGSQIPSPSFPPTKGRKKGRGKASLPLRIQVGWGGFWFKLLGSTVYKHPLSSEPAFSFLSPGRKEKEEACLSIGGHPLSPPLSGEQEERGCFLSPCSSVQRWGPSLVACASLCLKEGGPRPPPPPPRRPFLSSPQKKS